MKRVLIISIVTVLFYGCSVSPTPPSNPCASGGWELTLKELKEAHKDGIKNWILLGGLKLNLKDDFLSLSEQEQIKIAKEYERIIAKDRRFYVRSTLGIECKEQDITKEMKSKGGLVDNFVNIMKSTMESIGGNNSEAYIHAKNAFNGFLKNKENIFPILSLSEKENYLKTHKSEIQNLLSTSKKHIDELKYKNKDTKDILTFVTNSWLNYKGSIFDSENAIDILYENTTNKELKRKIENLKETKVSFARLYQQKPNESKKREWKEKLDTIENSINTINEEIAVEAQKFREAQNLKIISYLDIAKELKADELYIDYADTINNFVESLENNAPNKDHYYIFTINNTFKINFIKISDADTAEIKSLINLFRKDIQSKVENKNTVNSKKILSKLYTLLIEKPLKKQLKEKNKLIISADKLLRILPFEALYNNKTQKYMIEEKEIRYMPNGREFVRLHRYAKNQNSNTKPVIFANPNYNKSIKHKVMNLKETDNRSATRDALFFRKGFKPLTGTKAEAKAIKIALDNNVIEYLRDNASEDNLLNVNRPKILHIATHGFFLNDKKIINPMLKSGIILTGANYSIMSKQDVGIVTALKLSGLNLKGTDLVVLSACETGVVDTDSTDSISGLGKAFIQAGAKDIVMSLWSVNDNATKELMSSFYSEIKGEENYSKALKVAKLKMINENKHPFYWAGFVLSGL